MGKIPTYIRIYIFSRKFENLSSIFSPMRAAGEFLNQDFREVLV